MVNTSCWNSKNGQRQSLASWSTCGWNGSSTWCNGKRCYVSFSKGTLACWFTYHSKLLVHYFHKQHVFIYYSNKHHLCLYFISVIYHVYVTWCVWERRERGGEDRERERERSTTDRQKRRAEVEECIYYFYCCSFII